jgi:hypothetical protein
MIRGEKKILLWSALAHSLICALIVIAPTVRGTPYQQETDANFDAKVARPAYTTIHPRVVIDAAHNNFHTAERGYKPFAGLITSDGYQVSSNKEKFQPGILKGIDILVIANALGAIFAPEANKAAFTEEECDAVRDWVRDGGALLLIADHAPIGEANEILSRRFEVEMSKVHTVDRAHADLSLGNEGWIVYSRENGLLGDHPVTQGRNAAERINSVTAFTGQSLKGPQGSTAFLRLADTALDVDRKTKKQVSAAGRAQGIALRYGKGRVVILGEAAMMTAQLAGAEKVKFGMNRAGNDNKQLALNIMHWLSGLLDG